MSLKWKKPSVAHDCFSPDIAALADGNADLLVPDEGCEYDQVIHINLDEVARFSNARCGGTVPFGQLQIVFFIFFCLFCFPNS